MTQEARSAYNQYMREWRKKNPEKSRAYKEKFWERRAEQIREEHDQRGEHCGEIQQNP